jgi:NADH-quinone oxidoreductase subunit J
MDPVLLIFYFLALAAVGCGLMVIVQKNPVISALFLVMVMLCLAGIYLLMGAEFIAAIQVIVYAGAIMVLFLFVIMLLNLEKEVKALVKSPFQKLAALMLVGMLIGVLGYTLFTVGRRLPEAAALAPGKVTNTQAIAQLLFSRFLLPFEITSVILLIAIIGVILIGKKKV